MLRLPASAPLGSRREGRHHSVASSMRGVAGPRGTSLLPTTPSRNSTRLSFVPRFRGSRSALPGSCRDRVGASPVMWLPPRGTSKMRARGRAEREIYLFRVITQEVCIIHLSHMGKGFIYFEGNNHRQGGGETIPTGSGVIGVTRCMGHALYRPLPLRIDVPPPWCKG